MKDLRRWVIPWWATVAVVIVVLVGTASPLEATLRIATAAPGGRHDRIGKVLAQHWETAIPGLAVPVVSTGGSPQNVELLVDGDAEMAVLTGEVAYEAYHRRGLGSGSSAERYEGLRLFAYLYPEVAHLLTRRDEGNSMAPNLAGARIATGIPGSRGEALFHALFDGWIAEEGHKEGAGVIPQYLAFEEALDQFDLGWIDGLFLLSSVPAPIESVLEDGRPNGLALQALPEEQVGAGASLPWTRPFTIPTGTYPGQEEPVRSLAVPVILAVRADVDEPLVYQLAQAFYGDGRGALMAAYPRLLWADAAGPDEGGLLPLHPGVERYLAESSRLR